ncbi:MAG: hypothetical protein NZM02_01095, partial [Patescibacteria group bacterium]|nr:hypothetical protein [Patescibacteria group bacterium]
MKKIFAIFLFIFLFIFKFNYIFAQTITPDLSPTLINNNYEYFFKCGFANTSYNKCCDSFEETIQPNQTHIGFGLDILIEPFMKNFKSFLIEKIPIMPDFLKDRCKVGKESYENGNCICVSDNTIVNITDKKYKSLCEIYFTNNNFQLKKCLHCVKNNSYYSGFGCIPFDLSVFISNFLLVRLIGLAGIIAFFCIIYSSFIIQS